MSLSHFPFPNDMDIKPTGPGEDEMGEKARVCESSIQEQRKLVQSFGRTAFLHHNIVHRLCTTVACVGLINLSLLVFQSYGETYLGDFRVILIVYFH